MHFPRRGIDGVKKVKKLSALSNDWHVTRNFVDLFHDAHGVANKDSRDGLHCGILSGMLA